MGNLFNALNGLKTNIFGGGNTGQTTPILRKSETQKKDDKTIAGFGAARAGTTLLSYFGIGKNLEFLVNSSNGNDIDGQWQPMPKPAIEVNVSPSSWSGLHSRGLASRKISVEAF